MIVLAVAAPQFGIWANVGAGVGAALLAAALSSTLDSIFGLDARPDAPRFMSPSPTFNSQGLQAVHLDLHAAGNDIQQRIDNAESLDLMFNTGRFVMANYHGDIDEALRRRGCRVRLIFSSPDSPAFTFPEFHRGLSPTRSLKGEVEETLDVVKSEFLMRMKAGAYNRRASLHVRLAPCIMTGSFLFINGTFLRFTPYLPYTRSSEVPVYDFEDVSDDCPFKEYMRLFERVWEESAPHEVVAYPDVATPQRDPH
jgi:hypothetical protein